MCGIVGYIGTKQAAPLLLEGLEKLEYRGYDSAGMATVSSGKILVAKERGRLSELKKLTSNGSELKGSIGIGHTRWATHGEPNRTNSHPHVSQSGRVVLVHNGIIENYAELKAFLMGKGYTFASETDSEVAAQLIDHYYTGDPVEAVRQAEAQFVGSYAMGILFSDREDEFIALRKDSPLIIGIGEGESFIASDIPALLKHTRSIIRLGERELAVVQRDGVSIYSSDGAPVRREAETVTWDAESAEKGGYDHFMLKEIMEQGEAVRRTVSPRITDGRVKLDLEHMTDADILSLERVYIVACGSSYHVGMVARYALERYAHLPVYCELASEFRYAEPMLDKKTLVIIISQSGETLDTLFALREAKARGARTLSIVNVVGSSIAVESDEVLYTWAGPEIAVATTKAYSTQLVLMQLIAIYFGRVRGRISEEKESELVAALESLCTTIEAILSDATDVRHLAADCYMQRDIFFIGRNIDHALALEGSLKLKEISYIHSEAYPAGELKHGTISLIAPGTTVIALCTYDPLWDKMISNIREVKARGANVIAIAVGEERRGTTLADYELILPSCPEIARPCAAVIPMQLFAYYTALLKGCDIDKPRNLAKSVTVE